MFKENSKKLSEIGDSLASNIYLVRPEKAKYLTANSLLFNDEKILLIDTGFQYSSQKLFHLKKLIYPDLILFSHFHIDHIYGCHYFPESQKMIHKSEREALKSIDHFINFCFNNKKLKDEDYEKWHQRFFNLLKIENLDKWDDLSLNNIQEIPKNYLVNLGEIQLEIVHLPGHSPGHCGVYEPINKIFFIADIDISGKFGPWYGWQNSDLISFKSSVRKLMQFINDNEISIVIPSHSKPVDKKECIRRLKSFNNVFNNREKIILDFITEKTSGTTIEEITQQSFIYNGKQSDPPFVWQLFERIHIEKHLEELLSQNLIILEDKQILANF